MNKSFIYQILSNTNLVIAANNQAGFSGINISELLRGVSVSNVFVSVVYSHGNGSTKGLLSYLINQNNDIQLAPYDVQISHTSIIPVNVISQFFARFFIPANYPMTKISIELLNCEDQAVTTNVSIFVG